ncbi:MAG: tol-pal system-associated acyl-CoA thioesterase [Pelagibacterales bacterium]|nr:tol-pal system-associated acyl-CoA thioesterase [Pelagibacterales bacterium]
MSNNFSTNYRIYYEDTDAGGVVYYANYLKFFERCRTDFLRSLGLNQNQLLTEKNLAFVVRKCEIEYLSPAKLDDLVKVEVEVENITAASISMKQKIYRDDKILSSLKVEIVCVDSRNFRPCRISDWLRNLLAVHNTL